MRPLTTILLATVHLLLGQVPISSAAWLEPRHHLTNRGGFAKMGSGIKAVVHPHPQLVGSDTFDQLLDHHNPSKGTFKQRYFWDASSWAGPGSPVFLFNPGEDSADGYVGYLDNHTLPGLYADTFQGAVIVIEHRYWGKSIPFDTLTAETLQYLDVPQSIMDMTHFAKTVQLSFDKSDDGDANSEKAPWVLIGGSYSGALAAWTQKLSPGVFWAYHATSAVIEAVHDFHTYFAPIEAALPRNCSADVRAVVAHVDRVLDSGNSTTARQLKRMFGLEHLRHDDFAEQITTPIWKWQGDHRAVFDFCDYMQSDDGRIKNVNLTSDRGLGLEKALPLYAKFVNSTRGEVCRQFNCDSHSNTRGFNTPTDLSGRRQWDWMLCHNPFGWWQVGPPESDGTNIVSSHMRPEHFSRQCALMFPTTGGFNSGSVRGFTESMLNAWTAGWDADFERVIFCNGGDDPWNSATVTSEFRPGGPRRSTDKAPVFVIPGGIHVPDLIIDDTPSEMLVVAQELEVMGRWLEEWVVEHSRDPLG
ncbi:hypothetical protein MCOR25_006989 [Pyricularia grisea]|uniref:Uncharacterized protein n=1 Tax=Pyricularia grisea TaxID=148305 RepID=A0A6P8BBW4_PYRGI|nr:uncharacterized protein PgNI_04063 [Pyricularia grisea]KAI6359661.1 hypothetical protein MCOR25_006989 [Pyricularia grisea]TLD13283.1 hypothetical protein PgNI_04063 [Pyricularia grisea]